MVPGSTWGGSLDPKPSGMGEKDFVTNPPTRVHSSQSMKTLLGVLLRDVHVVTCRL